MTNSGLIYSPYKTYPTKKVNQACSLGELCQNCRLHCTENVSTEERENLFHLYWKLADIDKQRQFIINTIHVRLQLDTYQEKKQAPQMIENNQSSVSWKKLKYVRQCS